MATCCGRTLAGLDSISKSGSGFFSLAGSSFGGPAESLSFSASWSYNGCNKSCTHTCMLLTTSINSTAEPPPPVSPPPVSAPASPPVPPPPPSDVISSLEVSVCDFLAFPFAFLAVTDNTTVATYTRK